tara:strand:- start:55621 stop:56124 length:504 start_codon:yes stop_codon:yes gene_type:complete
MMSREWAQVPEKYLPILNEYTSERPVRVGALAKALGLEVKSATLKSGISGEIRPSESADAGFKVRVNRHEVKTRQRFTIAHEIAHFLLHQKHIGSGISDTVLYRSSLSSRIEAEANRLAADIVMPAKLLREDMRDLDLSSDEVSAETLAEIYEVSKQAMKVRVGLGR